MRKWFRALVVLLVISCLSALVYAGSAEDALKKLKDGNARFASGRPAKVVLSGQKRAELAKGQHPFAVVVACSDSRVGPEIIFNQGLGDIFVVRVAGNVVDKIALGSIEYAVEHLHSPLLVILGHQSCGAVKAAMEAKEEPEGNIGEIIKKIKPAVDKAREAGKGEVETLDLAVQENAINVQQEILKMSPIVQELVHEGKLKVVVAEYYLDSGKVKILK